MRGNQEGPEKPPGEDGANESSPATPHTGFHVDRADDARDPPQCPSVQLAVSRSRMHKRRKKDWWQMQKVSNGAANNPGPDDVDVDPDIRVCRAESMNITAMGTNRMQLS